MTCASYAPNTRAKPQRTRRHHVPADAARTIAALLTVRDQVIAPLLAGIRTPRRGRAPKHWTNIDRDYETLRLAIQNLFGHLGIATKAAADIDNILSIAVRQASSPLRLESPVSSAA